MALDPASPSEFKARYPVFAGLSPDLLRVMLTEATGQVDETWAEGDRKPAMMAYAAHLLSLEGLGVNTVMVEGQSVQMSTMIQQAKVGDVAITLAKAASTAGNGIDAGSLASTAYGQTYLRLLRRNRPAFLVV